MLLPPRIENHIDHTNYLPTDSLVKTYLWVNSSGTTDTCDESVQIVPFPFFYFSGFLFKFGMVCKEQIIWIRTCVALWF